MTPITEAEWQNIERLLSLMTLEEVQKTLDMARTELARRAGQAFTVLRDGVQVAAIPKGGAFLVDRPAIGGDRDEWFPSLEAANAALLQMAASMKLDATKRKNGTYFLDYTHPGCCSSEAYTEVNK